jgi:hypothetical protein
MRRILLGGIAAVLGANATPAAGQDPRTSPPQQHQRVARLGQPIAVPEAAAPDPQVTPAGLLRRQGGRLPPTSAMPPLAPPPGGTVFPPGAMVIPPGATVVSGSPLPGVPSVAPPGVVAPPPGVPVGSGIPMPMPGGNTIPGSQIPPPRPVPGSGPSVTEDRGTPATPAPTTAVPGYPMVYPGTTVIGPDGTVVPYPGAVDPYSGECAECAAGVPAVERVARCGGRWYVGGEYLMWWTRSADLPTLVTTSSPQFNGIPGVGDTRTVVGGPFGNTFHSGGRLTLGRWFGDSTCRGIDARMFWLGQAGSSFTATSPNYPLLARPFFNVNQPFGPFSEIVAANGMATGGVTVQLENWVWGAEVNYRRFLMGNGYRRLDGIVGYRYLNITERLNITENFARPLGSISGGVPAVAGGVVDTFQAENDFNGGQFGFIFETQRGRWSLGTRASIAFGDLRRSLDISGGQTVVMADGSVTTANGGLLALPGANVGKFTDHVFAVVPEVGVNIGYQLTPRLRVTVGYNFLYLGNALRPGDAIDPRIDAARIPNFPLPGNPGPILSDPVRPHPVFRSQGFFVQGISFGLHWTW